MTNHMILHLLAQINRRSAFLRSRLFAVALLAVAASAAVTAMVLMTRAVAVYDGDTVKMVMTMRRDPVDILKQIQITPGPDDVVETSGSAEALQSITLRRAFEVKVTADGQTQSLMLVGGTVHDALFEAGAELGEDDTVSHELRSSLSQDMHIFIDRIGYKTYEKVEKIAYTVSKQNTSTLKKGTTKVVTPGRQGERVTVFKDKIVNGEIVETIKVDQYIGKSVVNEVQMVGTASANPVASKMSQEVMLDAKGAPISYSKYFEGKATAYTAKAGAGTASGRKAMVGHVAVDPKKIPYGTRLYICSADGSYVYGYAVAADTGGAMTSGRVLVDVYFDTMAECRSFGAKTLRVYILD